MNTLINRNYQAVVAMGLITSETTDQEFYEKLYEEINEAINEFMFGNPDAMYREIADAVKNESRVKQ